MLHIYFLRGPYQTLTKAKHRYRVCVDNNSISAFPGLTTNCVVYYPKENSIKVMPFSFG